MNTTTQAPVSRRERWLLAAVAIAPLAIWLLVRSLGYMKYLKLAGLAAVLAAGALTIVVRPRWGLWFILFYVYAGLGFYFPFNALGMITIVVFSAAVLELILGGTNRLIDPLFWYANALFMLIAIGSAVWAVDPMLSFAEVWGYAKMLCLTYLIVQLVRTPDDLRTMMYVIFVGAVATVGLGLLNLTLGLESPGENYIGGGAYMLRFMGAHENPNRAAAYMCAAVPFGLFGIRHSRGMLRIAFVAGVLILVAAIFATFSRSVAFPLAMIIAAVMIREVRSKKSYVSIILTLGVGALFMPRIYWDRLFALRDAFETTTLDWSVYTRLLALRTAWEMFLDHPLTGIGIGNFITAAAHTVFVRIVVHNSYLEVLVGTGIFGLFTFLLVLYSGFRHSLAGTRNRWARHPAWVRSACFYCALSAVSIWVSAFFGTMPFRQPFWVPVAAGLVIANLLREDRELTPR